jgi:peroxiredoxin
MRDWAKNLGVDTNKVHMMADGEGMLHSKLGECTDWRACSI